MRLLILLASFFFLLAPAESRAGVVGMQKVKKAEGKLPKAGFLNYLLEDEAAAIITQTNHGNGTGSRAQSFFPVSLINAASFAGNNYIPEVKKYFTHSYSHCQSIGMKLLFPKHFFW